MALDTHNTDLKRKRKHSDNASKTHRAKKVKGEKPITNSEIDSTAYSDVDQQPTSGSVATSGQVPLPGTVPKPFEHPQNREERRANKQWKKQEKYRKMVDRGRKKKKVKVAKKPAWKPVKEDTPESVIKEEDSAVLDNTAGVEDPAVDSTKSQLRKEKKVRKKKRDSTAKQRETETEEVKTEDMEIIVEASKPPKKIHKKERESDGTLGHPKAFSSVGNWDVSKPAGGRFMDHDPVFSVDERFLFLATSRGVHVYSTSTSLLVRTLAAEGAVTCALSIANPSHLYIATASGDIAMFDWTKGQKISTSIPGLPICAITVVQNPETKEDSIFTIESKTSKDGLTYPIVMRTLPSDSIQAVRVELFWMSGEVLPVLKIFQDGKVIFAASQSVIYAGHIVDSSFGSLEKGKLSSLSRRYIWRTLKYNDHVTCLDAQERKRLLEGVSGRQQSQSTKSHEMMYDLVLGNAKGEIHVYEDIHLKLEENERQKNGRAAIIPIVWHWHRKAPKTVKWSLDGNYVISGGKETVLIIWQLNTAKRQALPHLTAAIEGLTVSPLGISYAVRMADNSIMVLSTTELKPKANIPGIQSRYVGLLPSYISSSSRDPLDNFIRTPAISNPRNAQQIFLAVPASQSERRASTPFLQSFDTFTARHVSRQALTRNFVTEINMGPEYNELEEPNVTLLRVSHDGSWLATIEEWTPPPKDVQHMSYMDGGQDGEAKRRRETYLKFWLWNQDEEHWMLETRIDLPHQSTIDPLANRVFDLVAHPSSTSFTTVGEDGVVRVWKPKTHHGDGTAARGVKVGGAVTWSCVHEVELDKATSPAEGTAEITATAGLTNGHLSYSDDGSILAASLECSNDTNRGAIQFLDAMNGILKFSEPSLHSPALLGMGFVGRYFMSVSNKLQVWDLVSNKLHYGFNLKTPTLPLRQKQAMSHFAINNASGTFAIALPNQPDRFQLLPSITDEDAFMMTPLSSSVMIFEGGKPLPVMSFEMPGIVSALIPLHGSAGYVVLDANSEFRIVSPKMAAMLPPTSTVGDIEPVLDLEREETDEDVEMEEDETGAGTSKETELDTTDVDMEDHMAGDKPVVRPEQLAEVLDPGSSFGLPSVKDLFNAVVGLYARKSES